MRFAFFPLRFEFVASESLHFPPGKAANVLRGALGAMFKRIAPVHQWAFAPVAESGPSGLADPPRPFVFRARHLDGLTIQPREPFHFDLHAFTLDPAVLAGFVDAFAALAHEGLGPRRGKAELQRVSRIAVDALPALSFATSIEPAWLDLAPVSAAPSGIRVEFLSPTELKHEKRLAARPEFPVLFGRIRDRISTLRSLYGEGPLDVDFRDSGIRAAAVRMTSFESREIQVKRRSSRTGRSHSIGGFVGIADYEGDLAEFLPYLEAARWTGVGRQAVWGKGEIALSPLNAEYSARHNAACS